MKTTTETNDQTTVVARIAGEDIQPGDYVTTLNELVELPSFLWSCSGTMLAAEEPVRVNFMPREAGFPFEVVAVCLPFVYAKRPNGKLSTFDTRRHQLVRLDPKHGRKVWKRMGREMRDSTR